LGRQHGNQTKTYDSKLIFLIFLKIYIFFFSFYDQASQIQFVFKNCHWKCVRFMNLTDNYRIPRHIARQQPTTSAGSFFEEINGCNFLFHGKHDIHIFKCLPDFGCIVLALDSGTTQNFTIQYLNYLRKKNSNHSKYTTWPFWFVRTGHFKASQVITL